MHSHFGENFYTVCCRSYGWELIAENAFYVFFKFAKVFPGCIWHERCQTQICILRALQWPFKNVFYGEETRIITRIKDWRRKGNYPLKECNLWTEEGLLRSPPLIIMPCQKVVSIVFGEHRYWARIHSFPSFTSLEVNNFGESQYIYLSLNFFTCKVRRNLCHISSF